MKKISTKSVLIAIAGLTVGLIFGLVGASGNKTTAASGPTATVTSTVTAPAAAAGAASTVTVTVPGPATTVTATPEAPPAGSTCDAAREAILTGSQAQITAALTALQNDKSANPTAREYARYYLGRDAKDAQMRELDISLIQTCS